MISNLLHYWNKGLLIGLLSRLLNGRLSKIAANKFQSKTSNKVTLISSPLRQPSRLAFTTSADAHLSVKSAISSTHVVTVTIGKIQSVRRQWTLINQQHQLWETYRRKTSGFLTNLTRRMWRKLSAISVLSSKSQLKLAWSARQGLENTSANFAASMMTIRASSSSIASSAGCARLVGKPTTSTARLKLVRLALAFESRIYMSMSASRRAPTATKSWTIGLKAWAWSFDVAT